MLDSYTILPVMVLSFIVSIAVIIASVVGLAINKRRFVLAAQISLPLAIIALAGTFAAYRFRNAGLWLPPLPDSVGNWKASDTPILPTTLAMLGNPMANGHEYRNGYGEIVYSSSVCAGPFENYHDPTVCVPGNGFYLTAKKTIPMGIGNWKVRAMIFKRTSSTAGDIRILMYYWTQTRKGDTATEARMGNFRDIAARFQTGYSAVIKGDQNVILRIYTIIPPTDEEGRQAQHNLNEICRETYKNLLADGAKKS